MVKAFKILGIEGVFYPQLDKKISSSYPLSKKSLKAIPSLMVKG